MPVEPELVNSGGACNVAMCGTLEDPQRWRAAWFIWGVGALMTLVAVVLLARPRQRSAWRRLALAVLVLICLPVSAFVGALVSLISSVQGFATVIWLSVPVPLVALAAAALRSFTGGRSKVSRTTLDRVELL